MKTIGIEELLRWTYAEELPKLRRLAMDEVEPETSSYGSTWRRVAEIAEVGVIVDRSGPTPGHQVAELPVPHGDALRIHDAVLGLLEDAKLAMPEGFDALGDIEGLTAEERAEAHALGWDLVTADKPGRLAALVIRRAMVGDAPPWRDHGQIVRRAVRHANGETRWFRIVNASSGPGEPAVPREVDGFDRSRRRPYRGAFQRFYLDPAPSLLVAERIEYQAWALALRLLADALSGTLDERDVEPPRAALWPWEGEEPPRGPRVLPVLISTGARQRPCEGA